MEEITLRVTALHPLIPQCVGKEREVEAAVG